MPGEHHDELEALVADARNAVRLRDDNGAFTAAWPMGLLRRAMLAAGRRLCPADPTVAVEATVDELVSLLTGRGSVTVDELDDRRRERAEHSALDAPQTIGPEFAIPPLDALPRPLGLIGAAQLATAEHMLGDDHPIGIGTDCYTGRALVVDDPTVAMAAFEPGDVIITSATSPSWNTLLVHAGALVTANGGLVSHAAVTARELGIPAVIGDAERVPAVAHRHHRHRRPGPGHRPRRAAVMAPFRARRRSWCCTPCASRGRASAATLPALTGLTIDVIDDELVAAVEAGWIGHHDGLVPGWSLTPDGRQRHRAPAHPRARCRWPRRRGPRRLRRSDGAQRVVQDASAPNGNCTITRPRASTA